MTRYVKTFKVENKINKVMSFHIDDEKLLEKYKAIWTKIKNFKIIELDASPVYGNRYIKTEIRTEDDLEYESFTVISIDSLIVYSEKYHLPVFLGNCAYKIVNK